MPTVKGSEWDLTCPECGNRDITVIGSPVFTTVVDGVVESIDLHPDSKDTAVCNECDYESAVYDFETQYEDEDSEEGDFLSQPKPKSAESIQNEKVNSAAQGIYENDDIQDALRRVQEEDDEETRALLYDELLSIAANFVEDQYKDDEFAEKVLASVEAAIKDDLGI